MNDVIARYSTYLELECACYDFEITDDLVKRIFFNHIYRTTKLPFLRKNSSYIKSVCSQLNYVRRSLLNVKYNRLGKASSIREGYVYVLTNPAWPGHFKIGSTISVYDRLATYQSYSPFRDYKIQTYFFTHDRFKTEKQLHFMFGANGEWVDNTSTQLDDVLRIFNTERNKDRQFLRASLTQLAE
ncbi:hypothetical protein 44RRORF121c [Aeromonas phage 44RR2.8t]|uniref:Uncharacterized protein n=1 Tax=Aeromonas phage 44RR2.8t TaxID=2907963 RepID=Q6U9I1_9CAUD|nr:hypothetical protein ST44RRORF121c [Aeromonas phage 44RR2.8t]AAQ81440.1 hypothetical protein 44RRORF121c [Aeromonas phage 44RR2.8t]